MTKDYLKWAKIWKRSLGISVNLLLYRRPKAVHIFNNHEPLFVKPQLFVLTAPNNYLAQILQICINMCMSKN